ncbi:TadE family type IV pilus minor pilin [Jatrophihabitans sp.]|jgi:Flp pilus assembly protein TadG|uniref:TadE family type IV pilus minor pilin n=1 Tax=Jatrophihabitans sp. TaxID=1932789 RepID=UPI002EF3F24E
MVTAETAMSLPVLVLLTLMGVAAVGVGQARVRCADAAGEAARAVARGDPASAAERARAAAGAPVAVRIGSSASDTKVTVRMVLRPVSWLPMVSITESAVVATEPGVPS